MKKNDKVKHIHDTIKSEIAQRDSFIKSLLSRRRLFIIVMCFFLVMSLIFLLQFSIGAYTEGLLSNGNLFLLAQSIGLFVISLIFRSMSSVPLLKKKQEVDLWFWKEHRKQIIYWFVVYALLVLASPFSGEIFSNSRLLFVSRWISLLIFLTCVFVVLWKPEFFMSGLVGGIGAASVFYYVVSVPFSLLGASGLQVFMVVLVFVIVIATRKIFWQGTQRGLNLVQLFAIRVFQPERLFSALRPYQKILNDQYKALAIKLRLDSEMSFGVKTELIKLYAKEYRSVSERYWFVGATLFLFLFMIQALGQNLIEDVIYVPIIKPLLCFLGLTTC